MTARRITYLVLLATAAVLHFAYGQYVTNYILLFLLLAPVLSLLFSLPAALCARAELRGGADVCRGRESSACLVVSSGFVLPPEAWSVTVEARNLFTGSSTARLKVRVGSEKAAEHVFSTDTTELGCIRYRIRSAWVFDYLGLIPIPVKKGGAATVTVFPDEEVPDPEPELAGKSARALRPKPQGFSEEHELRNYRDGDPLNLIHWKLSSKYDTYVVREPQEVIRRDIVLVIDPPARYPAHRSVLEQLCYINGVLKEEMIPYTLQYGKASVFIASENDFEDFLRGVLSEPMCAEYTPSMEVGADMLVYRILPGKGVGI